MTIEEGIKQAVTDFGKKILAEERLINVLNDYQVFESNDAYKIIVRHIIQNKCAKQFTPNRFLRFSKKLNDKDKKQADGIIRSISTCTGYNANDVRIVVFAWLHALGFYSEEILKNACSVQQVVVEVVDRKPLVAIGLLLTVYASQLLYLNFFYDKWWMSVCVLCLFFIDFILLGGEYVIYESRSKCSAIVDKNRLERFYKREIIKSYLPLLVITTSIVTLLVPFFLLNDILFNFYNLILGAEYKPYEIGIGTFLGLVGLGYYGNLFDLFSFLSNENKAYVRQLYTKAGKTFNTFKHVVIVLLLTIISTLLPTLLYLSGVIIKDSIEENAIKNKIEALDEINDQNRKQTVDLSYKELKLGASYQECVKQIEKSGSMEWINDATQDNGYFSTIILGGNAKVYIHTLDDKIYEIILYLFNGDYESIHEAYESKYGSTGFNEERQFLEFELRSSIWHKIRNGLSYAFDTQAFENYLYGTMYDGYTTDWMIEFANGSITISEGYNPNVTIIYRDKMLYESYIAICEQKEQQRLIDEENARKAQRQKEINDSIRVVKKEERKKKMEQIKKRKEVEEFAADI